MKRQFLLYLFIILFLSITTTAVILYGKGYRLVPYQGKIGVLETGLLVATSRPNGAGVFINGHLTSATDSTINLSPGEYNVKIVKEGYFSWEKKIKIQKEVVSKAEALLFTTAPKLESITDSGVANPVLDPSGTQIAFTVASQSARKNGLYILDMSSKPILTLQSALTQIADDTIDTFSQSELSWSPDGKELLASVSGRLNTKTTYLLKKDFNQNPPDVTTTLGEVDALWKKQKEDKEQSRIAGLAPQLQNIILENFTLLSWSLDEAKILYQASRSASLPTIIDPPLIGTNPTTEERILKKGHIYIYDIKEDKNFKILDSIPNLQLTSYNLELPLTWFPDSKHLIFVNNRKINIMDYDGTNKTVIYAGPFIEGFVAPWPDGSRLAILTNLGNENITPNLYTIGLK